MSVLTTIHRAHQPARPAGERLAARAIAMLAAPIAFLGRIRANRQVALALSRMDTEALADIGLSRQDVADLAALSPIGDAGAFLSGRVAERRHYR